MIFHQSITVFLTKPLAFIRSVKFTFLLLPLLLQACTCTTGDNPYRFSLDIDSAPTAYRNTLNSSEALSIPIKITNLSQDSLCLAGTPNDVGWSEGLVVSASVLSGSSNYLASPVAQVNHGFKSGHRINSVDNAEDYAFSDPHGRAVKELLRVGPNLLGLNPDDIKASYKAIGNEAFLVLTFPIDWAAVPTTPRVVAGEAVLEVKLDFHYEDGSSAGFSESFKHRAEIFIVNGPRGNRTFRPAADSPKTGVFTKPAS